MTWVLLLSLLSALNVFTCSSCGNNDAHSSSCTCDSMIHVMFLYMYDVECPFLMIYTYSEILTQAIYKSS